MFCVLPMPCQEAERDQFAPSDDPPSTPTKLTGNDGACADDQNGSTESENSSDDGLAGAKQKRKRPNAKYVLMKRWITGEEAEMEEEDIENEMFPLAHDFMLRCSGSFPVTNLRKPIIICGSSIVSTPRRREHKIEYFVALCGTVADARPEFG